MGDARVLISNRISGPVTSGRLILLPESLCNETSGAVLVTVIGHEMAHLARRDFGWNLACELLSLPLSFHPAIALLRRGIERTREMACDELVTARLIDGGSYARSMMQMVAAMTALPHPAQALGVFDGDILEERVRRLIERPAGTLRRARLALAAGLSALALCVVVASSFAMAARAQGSTNSPDREELRRQIITATSEKRFGDARQYAKEAIEENPKDKFAYYTIGAIDWAAVYPDYAAASDATGRVRDADVRRVLREKHMARIESAQQMLATALQLDPEYADALAYQNLLYRMQAGLIDDENESQRLIAEAEESVRRAKALAPGARVTGAIPPPPPPPPMPGMTIRSAPAPVITQAMRDAGAEGELVLNLTIGRDGHVRDVQVVSGPPALAQSVIGTVKQWTYEPLVENGVAKETTTTLRMRIESPK